MHLDTSGSWILVMVPSMVRRLANLKLTHKKIYASWTRINLVSYFRSISQFKMLFEDSISVQQYSLIFSYLSDLICRISSKFIDFYIFFFFKRKIIRSKISLVAWASFFIGLLTVLTRTLLFYLCVCVFLG